MLKKFLEEIVVDLAGKQAEEMVDLLSTPKYINEFLIAKKLNITVNQVRNMLYKLSDQGIVSHIRKKDKRKGWYTYFWKIEILKSLEVLSNIFKKRIIQIDYQIKNREMKVFYICKRCNVEFNEENALLQNFTCNECGNIFEIKDNTKLLRELKRDLVKNERKFSLVNEEIKDEKEKIEKKKMKIRKKEEKLKKEKRMKNKITKKLVKKPIKKKTANKTLKKKVVKKKIIAPKKVSSKKSKKKLTKKVATLKSVLLKTKGKKKLKKK
jgi:transcription factor E|tara:strand:- start:1650 stop:2450 length:801 start_codon:yes stop_codon:yes gene_type:complete